MAQTKFFEQIKLWKPRSSTFDLSYQSLMTADFGSLIPCYFEDVIPGDKFRGSSEFFLRFMPLIAPVMHNIDISVHYFFVPERLVWSNFGDWIKGFSQENSPVPPYLLLQEVNTLHESQYAAGHTHDEICGPGSLWDYLGYPVLDENQNYGAQRVKANRLLAYALIYREYYRDQNLTEETDLFETHNGRITQAMMQNFIFLQKRAWEKDYFTSALPWPQRGADVHLPLTGDAPVSGTAHFDTTGTPVKTTLEHDDFSDFESGSGSVNWSAVQGDISKANITDGDGYYLGLNGDMTLKQPEGAGYLNKLHADLSQVTAATINDLRKANALQKWFELKARAGNRLKEFLLSNFGIAPRDLRLDRPEYLGGGKQPVVVMDVLQNSATDATSPQGNLAGQAAAYGRTNRFFKKVDEHGFIIGLMSIMPKAVYMDGCPKNLQKFDQLDYYFPVFQHLGEQEIKNSEIFFSSSQATNEGTFGYTPRYAEYKFHNSEVHGLLRTEGLNFWTLARKFSNTPTLSPEFVTVRPEPGADDLNRIFAAQEEPGHMVVQVNNKVRAIRPMDYYSVPSL